MSRIKVISPENANGRLKEIYTELEKKRGKIANIHTIQSLRPESIVKHLDLYMEIMYTHSPLSRAEREMMAVVVSVANGCNYCQLHHTEALRHYWKNPEKISLLASDFRQCNLTTREMLLCEFAMVLTKHPETATEESFTNNLRQAGLSDEAILDATLVIAYFNFVNRIVLALDVESAENEIQGYRY